MKITQLILYFLLSFCSSLIYTLLFGQAQLLVLQQPSNLDEKVVLGLVYPGKGGTAAAENGLMGQENQRIMAVSGEVVETAVITETLNHCGNSERWLNAKRYGNINEESGLSDQLVQQMIVGLDDVLVPRSRSNIPTLLNHTICHESSRFRKPHLATDVAFDERTIRNWAVRLVYLSLHYHQHKFAQTEVQARYRPSGVSPSCPSPSILREDYGVGVMDYECPKAKYLILGLSGNGLGANVRGGMVLAYLLGLLSNRVVLFINKAKKGGKYLREPWALASCPREDYQCFFMPPSPCTLTDDEIENAHQLSPPEFRQLMRYGGKARFISHHKVWSFTSPFIPITYMPQDAMKLLYKYSIKMISAVPKSTYPDYVEMLKTAAKTIKVKDSPRTGYDYAAASYKMHHALGFYSMRPNPTNARKLEDIMQEVIPSSIEADSSIGLPIRASDKCDMESDCLSFSEHMEVVNDMWRKHMNVSGVVAEPTVVFTTESKKMVEEQVQFAASVTGMSDKFPFKYGFVTNSKDVLPDSGLMRQVSWKSQGKSDADEIMLSAVSSLKAQLVPHISIGNCCSNFHAMLNDFLSEGCGAATSNQFLCLQEYEDPRLQVCCGWHHECKRRKEAYLNNLTVSDNQS